MPPRKARSKARSNILTETATGHCLIDAFASIDECIPTGWHTIHHTNPVVSPYDSGTIGSSKKRKREPQKSENEALAQLHHQSVVSWLEEAVQSVREQWLATGPAAWVKGAILPASDTSAANETELDLAALELALRELPHEDDAAIEDTAMEHQFVRLDLGEVHSVSLSGVCHRSYMNQGSSPAILRTPAGSFMIPPRSGFSVSDLTSWRRSLSAMDMSYDLVIMDPPWRSKSVRRSSSYREMDLYDLYEIDLPNILLKSAAKRPVLIGIWVTNHPKYRTFVKEKLLRDWNVHETSDWYWVKITSSDATVPDKQDDLAASVAEGGMPVWSLHGPSPRRCYEGLILGWHNPFHLPLDSRMQGLPKRKAFLSVPIGHSRKPQVLDLLSPYLQTAHPSVLELFARCALSGPGKQGHWMAMGNESIKYNQIGVHVERNGGIGYVDEAEAGAGDGMEDGDRGGHNLSALKGGFNGVHEKVVSLRRSD